MIDKKNIKRHDIVVVLAMLIGTLIYTFSVVWILDLGEFYAGGVTGIAQLLSRVCDDLDRPVSSALFIFVLNIPLFIIGVRGVSKRFAVLSMGSTFIQVVSIYFFEYLKFKKGINFFEASFGNEPLILAILGGLLCGFGSGITLRNGASTGGMDILSQYLTFKKNIPFTRVSLSVDLVIIVLGGFVAGDISVAIYTIIRLIIHILVLDRMHTIYNFMKITVITTKDEEVIETLISQFNHGITVYDAIGGYSKEPRKVLEIIVSSFEVDSYSNVIKQIDPQAFISYSGVKGIDGNFNKNVIA